MSSPGNGPSTINSGETVWGGYSFTYPTVHEAAKLEVRSGTLTLIVDCEGNPKTITVNLPDASYSTPREEKVANPLVWYPTSSESGQTAFQGSGTAPTCPSPMQVTASLIFAAAVVVVVVVVAAICLGFFSPLIDSVTGGVGQALPERHV
jgi:hypothetical protein